MVLIVLSLSKEVYLKIMKLLEVNVKLTDTH